MSTSKRFSTRLSCDEAVVDRPVLQCYLHIKHNETCKSYTILGSYHMTEIEDLAWAAYKEEDGHQWDGFRQFFTRKAL